MGWFRSNRGKVAWLAFFALACQFALTFGHIHLNSVRSVPAISADPANTRSLPQQKAPAGLAQDFCAVCNNISLANALVLPASPAAIPAISIIDDLQWLLVTIEVAPADHLQFRARGPPHV